MYYCRNGRTQHCFKTDKCLVSPGCKCVPFCILTSCLLTSGQLMISGNAVLKMPISSKCQFFRTQLSRHFTPGNGRPRSCGIILFTSFSALLFIDLFVYLFIFILLHLVKHFSLFGRSIYCWEDTWKRQGKPTPICRSIQHELCLKPKRPHWWETPGSFHLEFEDKEPTNIHRWQGYH